MNITVTDIPFALKEKKMSLKDFLQKYVSFVQDKENIKAIQADIAHDDGKRYSLEEIRKKYVRAGV